MSITQKIQTFAHNLSRLKENGKLAFRKRFDRYAFQNIFKRNGLSTGKSTAIIPEMECDHLFLAYRRNGYSGIFRNIFLFGN